MGSPLGPLMANAFMVKIEQQLQRDARMPSFYRRYVDDTVALFATQQESTTFLDYLNSVHPALSFTCEVAENRVLPFLGMCLSHENGTLATSVHRKSTNKGLLLHYRSQVDTRYKKSLVRTMLHRAYELSSSWHSFHQECMFLRTMFARLCYPDSLVLRSIKELLAKRYEPSVPTTTATTETTPLILPFISNRQSSKLRSGVQALNSKLQLELRPVFTSTRLQQLLRKPETKAPLISRSRVVYQYTCACDKRYVGYTNRHLHERIAEHRRESSAIWKHCRASEECVFNEDRFSVLARCSSKAECMVRESIEIYFRRPELNAKDEYHCSILYTIRD